MKRRFRPTPPRPARRARRGGRRSAGIALLMVISAITILALVLVEFSGSTRTHLSAGTNIRDDIRAQTTADTALVLTRACLDPTAWGAFGSFQSKLDLERLCQMMLAVFTENRLDLPFGGISLELEGLEGAGLSKGEIESIELKPESAFIGLAGLACPNGRNNCPQQQATVRLLRTVLCHPRVAYVFEREQADGKEYTRAEIIGNLIDWMDSDDTRVEVDIFSGAVTDDLGEGEDSYYRDVPGDRYRSKDAPLDSIEELRMIRGINEDLFAFLRPQVSAYSAGKIDINKASAQVIATLLKSSSALLAQIDRSSGDECAETSETREEIENLYERYAELVVGARDVMSFMAGMANPFKGPQGVQNFTRVVGDPISTLMLMSPAAALSQGNPQATEIAKIQLLQARGWPPQQYYQISQWAQQIAGPLQGLVTTDSELYRLRARARVGNITRTVFAVLKRDGKIIRTLYYREE